MRLCLLFLLSAFLWSGPIMSQDKWKFHPNFLHDATHLVETPEFVYFTSRKLPKNDITDAHLSLFRYDKKGDELISLSQANLISDEGVRDIIYNPVKKYLFVLNENYDIDLLHNDGSATHIPYYRLDNSSRSKNVNGITVDPANNRVYMATDFGYVAINDQKMEIAESRDYNEPVLSYCRLGDVFISVRESGVFSAPVSELRYSLDEFKFINSPDEPRSIYPISDTTALLVCGSEDKGSLYLVTYDKGEFSFSEMSAKNKGNIENISGGLSVKNGTNLLIFSSTGDTSILELPSDYSEGAAVSANKNDVWYAEKYKGLKSIKKSGGNWVVNRDFMTPDSPSVYAAIDFVNHPKKGLLLVNYGFTPQTYNLYQLTPLQINAYKSNRWTNYSPSLLNPRRSEIMYMANGLAIDPDNDSYIYVSSPHHGFMRMNLDNPEDIIHFSRENDKSRNEPGFIPLVPVSDYLPNFANFSAPRFDTQGNLWMTYSDWDDRTQPNPHLFCWTPESRKAFFAGDKTSLPVLIEVELDAPVSNTPLLTPLSRTGKGLLVFSDHQYNELMALIDTGDTPLDTNDYKVYKFSSFTDNDDNQVNVSQARFIWEDPVTGYVWVGHRTGVFYFVPDEIMSGYQKIYRVKVSRNDGTNLADYLLDGVPVNGLATDAEGRKWFALDGGGLVCTSSDGTEIIGEFTADNSGLPDNCVYGIAYNPHSNSMMISTGKGLSEYFLPGVSSAKEKIPVKIFPNPVRPDYGGYVTITDIPAGALVKIVDAHGNLIKELERGSGFDIQWDISDSNFKRVSSGVYYILVSVSGNGNFSTLGKILVIS